MIPKIIQPDAFDFGMPTVALIDTYSKGFHLDALHKRASLFDKELNDIKRKDGYTYLHLITTGAGETYGANSNGDYFNKEACEITPFLNKGKTLKMAGGLKEFHNPTFLEFGKVYKNHCFPAGTKVQAADGSYKAIEAYAEGDMVNTRKGPRKVQTVFSRPYSGAGVTIACAGMRELRCTEDHPVFVIRRENTKCQHNYTVLHKDKPLGHCTHCKEWQTLNKQDLYSAIEEVPASSVKEGDWMISQAIPTGNVSVASSDAFDLAQYTRKYCIREGLRRRSSFVTTMLGSLCLHKVRNVNGADLNETVYNLEVEDAHEYFAEGLLVHNCNRHKGGIPSGYIVKAAYNDEMSRGELIIGVDNSKWEKELQKVANEKPIFFSMACDVKHDTCSACGNQATKLSEYCTHLKNDMLGITKEGFQVYAINDKPLFHDISGVFKPADKIAFALRKVASDRVLSSAELADLHGLAPRVDIMRKYAGLKASNRVALLSKLAAIEKEILASTSGDSSKDLLLPFTTCKGGVEEFDDSTVNIMKNQDPGALFGSLKDKMVIMPMETFMKVITGNNYDQVAPSVPKAKKMLPGIFGRMLKDTGIDQLLDDGSYEPSGSIGGRDLTNEISRLIGSHSLAAGPVQSRVIKITITGRGKRPDGEMLKSAAEINDATADFLAKEYARYIISFADGLPENKLNLTVAQTIANSI